MFNRVERRKFGRSPRSGMKASVTAGKWTGEKYQAVPNGLNEEWPGTYEAAYRQGKKWRKRIQQEKWRICRRGMISAGNH